jgi:hypothetical protein
MAIDGALWISNGRIRRSASPVIAHARRAKISIRILA